MPTDRNNTTRKLRAILSADVKGYSLLMADDEAFTIRTLKDYRNIMSTQIVQHNGRVVDSPGDNILADFASIVDAVTCAVEIQKSLKVKNEGLPDNKKLEFRIGVNIGDVVQDGDRIYGNGVNVAARIEGLAEPGGVSISRNAYDHIRDKLELGYEYLGEHSVKNIKHPVRVYKVLMDPEDAGKLVGDEPRRPRKKWFLPVAVAAAIIATSIGWYFFQNIMKPDIEPASIEKMVLQLPDKPSIAVLPFNNFSKDPEQDYIADGITENIITTLSKMDKLFVIARNSVFTYKGKPVAIRQVSEDLGVRYVLEGSVQISDNRIRITAQLIDAIKGTHIWAQTYDKNIDDIFQMQDEIALKVLESMRVELTEGEQAILIGGDTKSLDAYLNFLKASVQVDKFNKEGNMLARKALQAAIDIDPMYPSAYRALAFTHLSDIWIGVSKDPKSSIKKAFKLLEKVRLLDENSPGYYFIMSQLLLLTRQYDKAIKSAERAVSLDPNNATFLQGLALILRYIGEPERALSLQKKVMRLNPHPDSMNYTNLGLIYLSNEKYEEAIQVFKKATKISPNQFINHISLASAYSQLGFNEKARAAMSETLALRPQLSIEWVKTLPYRHKTDLDRVVAILEKAGLPKHPPLPLPDKPSIAVLAFDNLSGDPEQEYFSDGMTDELIGDLAKINDIFVISRNSAFTYKGKSIKVQQIAKDLNVRYILEGSVQRSGNKVRIRAQLIDGKTDHHLWSESYDGVMDDIFELQDKITGKIVSALAVKLSAPELNIISDKGTENPLAHEAYLKGQAHLRLWTPDDLVAAIDLFERALKLDPNFSQVYTALAAAYSINNLGGREYFAKTGKEYFEAKLLMRHYINLAMENPTPKTYSILAGLELQRRNFDQAILYANKALNLAPNDADILKRIGLVLVFAGQPDRAIPYLNKSRNLDPLNRSMRIKGGAYFVLGKYEEAANCFENSITNIPDLGDMTPFIAATYAFLDQEVKAKKALETWLSAYVDEIYPDTQTVYIQYTFKDEEVFNRLVNGLIKAGWKAEPKAYYSIQKENKLDGEEISTLVFGKTLSGTLGNFFEWSAKITDDGNVMSSNNMGGAADKGKTWIESDLFCYQYEKRYGGIKYCYDIYRNKKGDKISKSEYLLMGDNWTLPFSVFE